MAAFSRSAPQISSSFVRPAYRRISPPVRRPSRSTGAAYTPQRSSSRTRSSVKREGKDVTLVAVGLMVSRALEAAEKLAAEGIEVEVVDPRTIAPLDKETIFASIRKTHRAAVVEESNKTAGVGAELAALFQEELYDELDGPVARIAALDVPMPYNIPMEHYSIPDVNRIVETVRKML